MVSQGNITSRSPRSRSRCERGGSGRRKPRPRGPATLGQASRRTSGHRAHLWQVLTPHRALGSHRTCTGRGGRLHGHGGGGGSCRAELSRATVTDGRLAGTSTSMAPAVSAAAALTLDEATTAEMAAATSAAAAAGPAEVPSAVAASPSGAALSAGPEGRKGAGGECASVWVPHGVEGTAEALGAGVGGVSAPAAAQLAGSQEGPGGCAGGRAPAHPGTAGGS
eukprot:jgi/Ulvmu1/9925/UM058_0008.1